MLNRNGKSEHPYFAPDLRGESIQSLTIKCDAGSKVVVDAF
jgi:hypothetical protein